MRKPMLYILSMLVMLTLVACSTTTAESSSTAKATEGPSESATRVVSSAFGDITIPVKPKNMLILNSNYAENLIELGVIPDMVTLVQEIEPEYRPKLFNDNKVTMIEVQQYEENLELILAAAPDLIIVDNGTIDTKRYEALSQIAPTVAVEAGGTVRESVAALGKLFHKEKEAELALSKYNDKIKNTKEKLQQALGDQTILVLRVEQNQYRVLGQEAGSPGSGILYNELGLHIPEQLKDYKDWFTPMSMEIFPKLKADHIFVEQRMMQNYSSEQSMKDLENSPIWKGMEAVKKGHVYRLETADFVVGEGLIGTPLLLDYLADKLVP